MPSEMVVIALIANVAVVVAAWISSHRKLTHITEVTNSNLAKATEKADDLEAKIHDLRDGELKEAKSRIDRLEATVSELKGKGRP